MDPGLKKNVCICPYSSKGQVQYRLCIYCVVGELGLRPTAWEHPASSAVGHRTLNFGVSPHGSSPWAAGESLLLCPEHVLPAFSLSSMAGLLLTPCFSLSSVSCSTVLSLRRFSQWHHQCRRWSQLGPVVGPSEPSRTFWKGQRRARPSPASPHGSACSSTASAWALTPHTCWQEFS